MSDPTFVAFIDESGCDGDKFGTGSSEFLIISAAVGFDSLTCKIEDCHHLLRHAAQKAADWTPPKFDKCKGPIQWALAGLYTQIDFFAAHVFIHKPSIKDVALRTDRNRLYRFGSKLLIERISWICESLAHPHAPGNGLCRIVFSQDLSRSYVAFKEYVRKLAAENRHNTSIKWDFIDPELIEDAPFKSLPALLLADFHASAMGLALEKRAFGQFDGRIAQRLSDKILLSPEGKPFGFGYKLWPKEAYPLWGGDERFSWMRGITGQL